MVGLRSTTLPYKNKKPIRHPESEQILMKDTHEPLITQELWDIVQDVRKHKKRTPKNMDEPTCSRVRRVTHFARQKEKLFADYINQKNSAKLRKEMNGLQKELDAMRRRDSELTALFKRFYEDNVLGRVTNEQFRILSGDYNAEQKELATAIPAKETRLQKLRDSAANVEAFIKKAKRYTEIRELTPEILRLFISRIEVGEHGEKHSSTAEQSIRIVYRDVGVMDSVEPADTDEQKNEELPEQAKDEQKTA